MCSNNLAALKQVCSDTGTPVAEDKCEGPFSVITFLGIELDSSALEIWLSNDKLQHLKSPLADWRGRKAAKKRDLLSLIGSLQHAAKAVRQGRSFVRRLINLSTVANRLDSFVRLNVFAR